MVKQNIFLPTITNEAGGPPAIGWQEGGRTGEKSGGQVAGVWVWRALFRDSLRELLLWEAGLFPLSTKGFLVYGELPTSTAF